MMLVKDFTAFVDKRKAEYMDQLKKGSKIPADSTLYIHLNQQYRDIYQAGLPDYVSTYWPEKWKPTVARHLPYRRPCLVNAFDLDTHMQA